MSQADKNIVRRCWAEEVARLGSLRIKRQPVAPTVARNVAEILGLTISEVLAAL
jgi:hypothetical protein